MSDKDFKTIDQQVLILESRGMIFNDVDKAKRYLLTNNYYNIINGYSKYFKDSGTDDRYLTGTNFDEVCRLYLFDKEVKKIFMDFLLMAEHHLKSIVSYEFSKKYPEGKYNYLNINCYAPGNEVSVVKTISKLSGIINYQKNQRDGNAIRYYYHEYHNVPIWVLIDFVDFGTLYYLINQFENGLQESIANDLNSFLQENIGTNDKLKVNDMLSFIKNMSEVRNICAHGKRLLEFECDSSTKLFRPIYDRYILNPRTERKDVYSTMVIMQTFLSHEEYSQLHNSIRKRFRTLNNNLSTIDINKIILSLGFSENWHNVDKLTQNSNE